MRRRNSRGFTIVELMITLVVAGILLVIGVPGMQALIRNNRLTTQANLLVGDLQLARSEAIRRRQNVALRPVSGTADWSAGWRVWVDTDGNGVEDAGEQALRIQGALSGGNALVATSADPVIYRPTGFVTATFSADLCHASGLPGRRITISATGRVETDPEFVCP